MKKQISVVGAVVVRGSTVLSTRRSRSMTLPGMWEFPGGKIEPDETPQEALRREVKEELLCVVEIGDHVETTVHEYDFGVVTLMTFFATLIDGEPRLTEHSELRWISVDRLGSVDWAPADLPAVQRVATVLRG